jgi:hypothetical protein
MGRGKGWQPDEIEAVCRAYVAAGNNPVKGNQQPREVFWKKVGEAFYGSVPPNHESGTFVDRRVSALKCCILEKVLPEVNKFNIQLRKVDAAKLTGNPSEQEKINMAVALHKRKCATVDYDYRFFDSAKEWDCFLGWFRVLRHEPKWEPPSLGQPKWDAPSLGQPAEDSVVVVDGDEATTTTLQTKRAKRGSGAVGRDKSKAKMLKNTNMDVNRKNAAMIANELKLARESIVRSNYRLIRTQELQLLMQMAKADDDDSAYKKARSELRELLNQPHDVPASVVNPCASESTVSNLADDDLPAERSEEV